MMRRNETIILAALICFSAGCIASMAGGGALVLRDEVMPADLYSNVIAAALGAACIVRLFLLYGKNAPADAQKKVVVFTQPTVLIGAISLLYTLGIASVGFYISTFICMFALFFGFERWEASRAPKGLAFSLGLCVMFYVTFTYMKIYLPDAMLF